MVSDTLPSPRRVRPRTEAIRRHILEAAFTSHTNVANSTASRFKITRQAANRHIQSLTEQGVLEHTGNTRARIYSLKRTTLTTFQVDLGVGVEEHKEWSERVVPVLPQLRGNVRGILNHAFNEMMNNAIDHSDGGVVRVEVAESALTIRIALNDDGVGIFRKIQDAFQLEDRQMAVLELAKGKLTTDPVRHTGEGIFFTSRMCDRFSIWSGSHGWHTVPGERIELIFESLHEVGTLVFIEVSKVTDRTTAGVFDAYTSGDDNLFSKTQVPVFVAAVTEDTLVSRSAARRVLSRLEKFKEVMLDFAGVDEIGQPFADEIFRVFANEHPDVRLRPINANRRVLGMIQRAQSPR